MCSLNWLKLLVKTKHNLRFLVSTTILCSRTRIMRNQKAELKHIAWIHPKHKTDLQTQPTQKSPWITMILSTAKQIYWLQLSFPDQSIIFAYHTSQLTKDFIPIPRTPTFPYPKALVERVNCELSLNNLCPG